MATHYVYDDPKPELLQGDILQKNDALLGVVRNYFPYYADHNDYKFFMVVTQTCDLVRRDGGACTSPYITIAAVKPLRLALQMEAAKYQDGWQRETRVIGDKAKVKLVMFLESLIDNNKSGYFYLHEDQSVGISESCCAFLQLSISLHSAEHYDIVLGAKIAQLKESFQAKLGWLIGSMYSRVATTEWNIEKAPSERLSAEVSRVLNRTFITYEEDRISEAVADLRREGAFGTKTPAEIAEYVKRKRLIPRSTQFLNRAIDVYLGMKISEPLRGKVNFAIRSDGELKAAIAAVMAPPPEGQPELTSEAKVDAILKLVAERASVALNDETLPGREKYVGGLMRELLGDAVLKKLLS